MHRPGSSADTGNVPTDWIFTDETAPLIYVNNRLRSPAAIDRVEDYRNNAFVYETHPDDNIADLNYIDMNPLDGLSYS